MRAIEDIELEERLRALSLDLPAQRIYVMPALPYVKVGISMDPLARWRALRVMNPTIRPPIFTSPRLIHARRAELAIHARLKAFLVGSGREWFQCPQHLAVDIARETVAAWDKRWVLDD
jgi:hypothetical protein